MIMKQYIIKGGQPLRGEVYIGGAKNAALGIIVAAIMADEPVTIENLPDVDDVKVLLEAIEGIFSPDGRVFGKMGHLERRGPFVAVNIPGEKHMPLFESGAEYFK